MPMPFSKKKFASSCNAEKIENGKTCTVTVLGAAKKFEVPRGDLLLMAALEQGINYPHTCRVGTCGRCRTKLVSGRISPQIDFALSPLSNDELEQGVILACQAKVRSDLEIDVALIDQKVIKPKMIAGTITHWQRLPGEVIDLRVGLEKPLHFQAGQYASIATSGSFTRRMFSFYDAPKPNGNYDVGFLIKKLPGGKFSEWLYNDDRRDVRVWIEAPFGQMGLDDEPRDALGVAGGTGIAPILSIARDRLRRFPKNRFTIVFGVRREYELFALDKLDEIADESAGRLTVIPILSDEPTGRDWTGATGLVTDAINSDLNLDFGGLSAFVCGSVPMVNAVEAHLLKMKVDPKRIHADKFEAAA